MCICVCTNVCTYVYAHITVAFKLDQKLLDHLLRALYLRKTSRPDTTLRAPHPDFTAPFTPPRRAILRGSPCPITSTVSPCASSPVVRFPVGIVREFRDYIYTGKRFISASSPSGEVSLGCSRALWSIMSLSLSLAVD